jgi:ATP-binding cassette subfamily F protein 3
MVPMIRSILGGFLFEGDDVYKKVGVLSGGERTRLAVARMLLRPANTLLLDEPTNHLDLDSKDVLLDALEDFGGTLVLVSHDRYFIDKLATKVIEIGGGEAVVYPGTYEELRWSKAQRAEAAAPADGKPARPATPAPARKTAAVSTAGAAAGASDDTDGGRAVASATSGAAAPLPAPALSREEKKRLEAEERRRKRASDALRTRIADLESRIAEREREMRSIEAQMSTPGFFDDRDGSRLVVERHQALMWEVGDLMHRWEELQHEAAS